MLFVYKKTAKSFNREPWITLPLNEVTSPGHSGITNKKYFGARLVKTNFFGNTASNPEQAPEKKYYLVSRVSAEKLKIREIANT